MNAGQSEFCVCQSCGRRFLLWLEPLCRLDPLPLPAPAETAFCPFCGNEYPGPIPIPFAPTQTSHPEPHPVTS